MKRSLSLVSFTALILMIFSRTVLGWEFFISPPQYAEGPIKWYESDNNPGTARITVLVDNGGLDSINEGIDGDSGVTAAIQALEAWNNGAPDTLITGVPVPTGELQFGVDGTSTLHFSDPSGFCSGNCLALTIVTYYDSGDVANGTVERERCNGTDYLPYYDVDIVTNDGFQWTSEIEDPGLFGCSNEYYIEAVMTHEAGHLLGLGHENDLAPAQALMYESLAACDQKLLQYDDLRGRDVIYDCDGDCVSSQPPNAMFSHATNGLTASFTDQSTDNDGNITNWSWNFGDGNASALQSPDHTYAASGTYSVSLTVIDNSGLTDSIIQTVSVSSPNQPPTADFSFSTTGLTASFTDLSTDDGTLTWSWNFDDGNTSTSQNPGHTYTANGTYSVSLTVTDDGGLTNTATQSVSVSSSTGISLSANGYKIRGVQHADLSWSGAESGLGSSVVIYRNDELITTITDASNPDSYTDNINAKGGGSYNYVVCNAGGGECSDPVNVTF